MYATKSTSVDYDPCPAGMHHAVCYRVIDLGTQKSEWQGQPKIQRKILVSWELPNELMAEYTDSNGEVHPPRPFTIHKKYTLSFHEKANLLKDLNSWRGRPFTEAELAGPPDGFYMQDIVGANCFLNVIHNTNDAGDKVYANIATVSPLAKGMERLAASNQPLFLDLGKFDQGAYDALSDGIKETINKSPEYQNATGGDGQQADKQIDRETEDLNNGIMAEQPPLEAYEAQF